MPRDRSQSNDRSERGSTTTSCLPGTLYVIGTPIGHPDDITIRALATLRRVTLVASENPRVTQALLAHHGITATITSYGPGNRREKMEVLLYRLIQGEDIALVSDNGTPVICDPGSLLVAAAHRTGIPVKAIPGPSTVTAVTAISGFSGDAILFEGCLPSSSRYLIQYLSTLRTEQRTLVLHIDSRALIRLLKILVQILPRRYIAIAIDLTTSRETLYRGWPGELLERIRPVVKDSAVTVVIEGYREGSHSKTSSGRVPGTTPHRGAE